MLELEDAGECGIRELKRSDDGTAVERTVLKLVPWLRQ